jgi:hypothetical protein
MPVAKHRSPNLTWSFELPDRLKIAIADAIVLYSQIESCCIEIIWELEQADLDRKKQIAKNWGDQNFKLIKRPYPSFRVLKQTQSGARSQPSEKSGT